MGACRPQSFLPYHHVCQPSPPLSISTRIRRPQYMGVMLSSKTMMPSRPGGRQVFQLISQHAILFVDTYTPPRDVDRRAATRLLGHKGASAHASQTFEIYPTFLPSAAFKNFDARALLLAPLSCSMVGLIADYCDFIAITHAWPKLEAVRLSGRRL